MNINHNRKDHPMRKIYIQRRIMVVLAIVLFPVSGFFTAKAMESYFGQPTFICQPAKVIRNYQSMWNIADKYCSGNISDATHYVMKTNGIKSKDLMSLRPSMTIVIKGGN